MHGTMNVKNIYIYIYSCVRRVHTLYISYLLAHSAATVKVRVPHPFLRACLALLFH